MTSVHVDRLERLLDAMAGPLFTWRMLRRRSSHQAGKARALAKLDALVRSYVADDAALEEARAILDGETPRPRG